MELRWNGWRYKRCVKLIFADEYNDAPRDTAPGVWHPEGPTGRFFNSIRRELFAHGQLCDDRLYVHHKGLAEYFDHAGPHSKCVTAQENLL